MRSQKQLNELLSFCWIYFYIIIFKSQLWLIFLCVPAFTSPQFLFVTSPKRLHFRFADSLKAHLAKMSLVPLILKDQNSGLSIPKSSVICSDLSLILQLWSDGSHSIQWCSNWSIKTSVLSSVVEISSSIFHRSVKTPFGKQWPTSWLANGWSEHDC